MSQLKYNFLGLEPMSLNARLEKVPNLQLFGRPRGTEFIADERECLSIREYAASCEREHRDAENSAHNEREMAKALHAMAEAKMRRG